MGASGDHYILSNLMTGERLICAARIPPLVVVPSAVLAAFGLFIALIGFASVAPALSAIGLVVFLVVTPLVLIRLVEQLTTEYSCTDRRIVIKSGLLTVWVREMPLTKVEALRIEHTLFGRLIGYGTLVFKGSGGTRRTCSCIEEPTDFYRQVQEQVARAQHRP